MAGRSQVGIRLTGRLGMAAPLLCNGARTEQPESAGRSCGLSVVEGLYCVIEKAPEQITAVPRPLIYLITSAQHQDVLT
jgi:hypothetical protein